MSTLDDITGVARLAARTYVRTAEWALRGALGAVGLDPPRPDPPRPQPPSGRPPDAAPAPVSREPTLYERGQELLRRSADVRDDQDVHPAFARILDELLPDEARCLRLLDTGPQPAVDVRAGALPLNATTELVAPGLTMIGAEAGCRHPERVPIYLNNLYRLGLIWFSREPVPDQARYQVLEAQPEVVEALRAQRRARTVRRSIGLTPFGQDFCARTLRG